MRSFLKCAFYACLVLVLACRRDAPMFKINNLCNGYISGYGHAGMGFAFEYPIDTYESIEPVLRIGADGTEMDIQMTKDSVIVLYHDHHLEDMTICTTGLINDKLWSEIGGCHIACPISWTVNLVSFDQLMARLAASGKNIHDYTFTFDCKLYTNNTDMDAFRRQYANAVLKCMDDHGLQDRLMIESQDTSFLRILLQKRSGLKLFIYPHDFDSGLAIAQKMGLYGITIYSPQVTAQQIKMAHDLGIHVTVWGVESQQDNMDAIIKSPDFVQTDKPIHFLKVFNRYKG